MREHHSPFRLRDDGSIEVHIGTRNADDLLYRLVGCCVSNCIPHRVGERSPQSRPEGEPC